MADQKPLSNLTKITEALNTELYNAIACAETLKPILYDKDIAEKFNNTYSAHIFNYLQDAIHSDGLSCVWRMWDPCDDSNSIPALMNKLEKAPILDAIKDLRRNAILHLNTQVPFWDHDGLPTEDMKRIMAKKAEKDAENAAEGVDVALKKIRDLISDKELVDLLKPSKDWRDRHIAHNHSTRLFS